MSILITFSIPLHSRSANYLQSASILMRNLRRKYIFHFLRSKCCNRRY